MENLHQQKMKGDFSICKAAGLPRLIKGVMVGQAAVQRQENILAFRSLAKSHILSQPALHPAAFIIIGTGAFLMVLVSVFKTVHIKLPHIRPDSLEIFYQLPIGHHNPPLPCF